MLWETARPLSLPAHARARWMQVYIAACNGNSCSPDSGLQANVAQHGASMPGRGSVSDLPRMRKGCPSMPEGPAANWLEFLLDLQVEALLADDPKRN